MNLRKRIWKDEYLKTICAFANSEGGILYIGISDNSQVVGLDDAKTLLEALPNKINNRLGLIVDVILKQSDDVDKIMDVLRLKYLKAYISYEGMHRREKLEYPYEALREAVINALIHRDYTNTSCQTSKKRENLKEWAVLNQGIGRF